jgi:hypothetical protein
VPSNRRRTCGTFWEYFSVFQLKGVQNYMILGINKQFIPKKS